jgi:glycosyltransferase involved in cell wall biosynthesis
MSVAPRNPYLRLLYEHLAPQGIELVERPTFSLKGLWRARLKVQILHFHWPDGLYRSGRGPARLRAALSWAKLVLFAARLVTARILGYRLVWTIHQVFPHESADRRLDRLAVRVLGRACHLLMAHDASTAAHARSELATGTKRIAIVPHGSYIGVYPAGRARKAVRDELGLPQESYVFLSFGEVRAYKEIDLLLAAFSRVSLPNLRLVIAGNAKTPEVAFTVHEACASDPRILALLKFVPDGRVYELAHAADAAVLPRGEPGTSGSFVLALSMGLPVVAADVQTARELTRDGRAGWHFRPHDVSSLQTALERAASDPAEARARGRCAFEIARRLDWVEIARDHAMLLRQT